MGGVWGGGGILPVITTAPCCQFHDCSVPGPHQQHSRIVMTDREHSCSAVTLHVSWVHQFDSSQRRTLEQELWHKPRLTHALGRSSGAYFALASLWIWSGGFWNLPEFTKAGPRTGSHRCGECSYRLCVRPRGAQRCCWTSRGRTALPISLSPLRPK